MRIDLEPPLGRLLKERRLGAGLTQSDLALMSGVTSRYVRKVENGEACPTLNVFVKMALAMNCSPQELLGQVLSELNLTVE